MSNTELSFQQDIAHLAVTYVAACQNRQVRYEQLLSMSSKTVRALLQRIDKEQRFVGVDLLTHEHLVGAVLYIEYSQPYIDPLTIKLQAYGIDIERMSKTFIVAKVHTAIN